MIRVIEHKTNKNIQEQGRDYFFDLKNFDSVDFSIPSKYEIITKISTKVLVWCFFWLLFIPLIWFYWKANKLKKILNDRIKINITLEDYNNFFINDTTHFNKIERSNEKNWILKSRRNIAVKKFPRGSRIDEENWTKLDKITFYNKYTFDNQSLYIKYHYYQTVPVTNSKGHVTYVQKRVNRIFKDSIVTGNIELIKDQNVIIGVNQRIKGTNKYEIENRNFNKKYKLYTNDKIATNLFFTPLTQENFLKLGGFHSFEISHNTFFAFKQYYGGLAITDDIQYKLSDMQKGIKHIKELSYKEFIGPILKLNSLYMNLLAAPIWSPKKLTKVQEEHKSSFLANFAEKHTK